MNHNLFRTSKGRQLPTTDAQNNAGGVAYAYSDEQALAQLAVTGTFGNTFYQTGEQQLDHVLELCPKVSPEYVGQVAVYAHEKGYMKDMPAFLLAYLLKAASTDSQAGLVLARVFPRVITTGRMLRGFVQFVRSGVTGRKSFGSQGKRLIRQWIEDRSSDALFRDSVGNDPSMADIIKMVHPSPTTAERSALYGYLIGRDSLTKKQFEALEPEKRQRAHLSCDLPSLVKAYEAFKKDTTLPVPQVPFQMLDSLEIGKEVWVEIARNASWHMTRMNLNTFKRHGVFEVEGMIRLIADRISDPEEIFRRKVFPYQLLAAYRNARGLPFLVEEALQDAMEIATQNVPSLEGNVYVCPDISWSMTSPVTGQHYGRGSSARKASSVSCLDVASLVSACILRNSRQAKVMPFSDSVLEMHLNPRDSVMTNAEIMRVLPSGGTNVSAPLALLNARKAPVDLVLIVSDNESWMDSKGAHLRSWGDATQTLKEWELIKERNPHARLVCIDITPSGTTQSAIDREDILNIGGWSDSCFEVISRFAAGEYGKNSSWVEEFKSVRFS